MANINKISVNNIVYDIEDKKAQSKLNDVLSQDKESKKGKLIVVDDAIPDVPPTYLPSGAIVYGFNMYKLNAITRETNGITFTVSNDDPNTVNVNGTATSNAYSYGSITTANAENLLDAGKYLLYLYSSDTDVKAYYNIISYSTGSTIATGTYEPETLNVMTLTEKCYVAIRLQVPSGRSVTNTNASLYFSKVFPKYGYQSYKAPNGNMNEHSVIMCDNDTDYIRYMSFIIDDKINTSEMFPYTFKVGTFNCGNYSSGTSSTANVPTGDLTSYANYIQSLNADILCTQEDREFWNISEAITMRSVLYDYLYEHGDVISKSTSEGGTLAKGIFSNFELVNSGKYTFNAQGTTTDGGSTYQWSSLTYYTMNIADKSILLVSVHLASKQWNESVREAQITEMLTLINAIGLDYVIIGGDLNNWNDELDLFINNGYVLANSGVYGEFETFYTGNHTFDNIVVTPNIKLRDVKAHTNSFQDHYALTATITIV